MLPNVTKRHIYGPPRLRELQNSLSEAYNILAVSKRGVGSPVRLRELKNNLDEAFSMLQVSKRSAQVRIAFILKIVITTIIHFLSDLVPDLNQREYYQIITKFNFYTVIFDLI